MEKAFFEFKQCGELEMVAMIAYLVKTKAESGKGLPYGFSSPEDAFDGEGNLKEDLLGLTCSSMVVAIFARARVPLVDSSTWEESPEDYQWQTDEAIAYIAEEDPEHAAALTESLP